METYPLIIGITNALTNSLGIAAPKNSIGPAILIIENISADKVIECLNSIDTPDENGNIRMLVLDLVRNDKYYRVALNKEFLPNFLGLTIIDGSIIDPDGYDYLDELINKYHVFDMELLPQSECLELQKQTVEWFKETCENMPSDRKDAADVMKQMYLSTKYNGRTVIMLSCVDESGKRIQHHMHYLDSINFDQDELNRTSSGDELDMAMVIDEVKAGNLQFVLTDIEVAAKTANYPSRYELIQDLMDKGYSPSNIDAI